MRTNMWLLFLIAMIMAQASAAAVAMTFAGADPSATLLVASGLGVIGAEVAVRLLRSGGSDSDGGTAAPAVAGA